MIKLITFVFLILSCVHLFGQNYSSKEVEYFNSQIGVLNGNSAKEDLKEGKILLLVLLSNFATYDPIVTGKQIGSIELRFGFKYDYRLFNIPQDFLDARRQEYNNVVYEYLDSVNNCSTKQEIAYEFSRYAIENVFISKTKDRQLEKIVRKEFCGKDRINRKLALRAEILYRDRDFKGAFELYNEIEKSTVTPNGKCFILSSKYHSLLNLDRFEEAYELLKQDNNSCISKRMKYKKLP